jgi:ribosome-binding protein aMBF1 (putative translation factor)
MNEGVHMRCLKCSHDKFVQEQTFFDPEIKGEVVRVTMPCTVCAKCKTPCVGGEEMNLLRRTAADTYRERHNLLTSEQLIAQRKASGMSQRDLAQLIGVEEVEVKRWEICRAVCTCRTKEVLGSWH